MKICIKAKDIINVVLLFILFLCICERLYNSSRISGKYSFLISILLLITGFIMRCIAVKKIKVNILKFIGIFPIIFYGFSTESIRYGVFFLIIYLWGTIKLKSVTIFNKIILLTGVLFSIIQILQGYSRISGFMYSPTIYSCNLVVIITYLLFEKKYKISNIIYIALAIYMIYLSESSSALLCAVGLIFYKILINFINYRKEKNEIINKTRFLKILILIGGLITAYFLFTHLEEFLSIIPRSNRDASTLTRTNYLNLFIDQLKQNKDMFLIGRGGGYTQFFIKNLIGTSIFYPLHQDILMLICEYGVLGLIYLYVLYLKDLKLNWIIWIVILLCSFHNLILSPTTICLIVLYSNSLNMQYDKKTVMWH